MGKYAVLLLPLFFLVRCQSGPGENDTIRISEAQKETMADSEYAQSVPLLDKEVFVKLLEANSGRILVINVWATWCMPCKEEFPDLVQLASEYSESQVTVVGISVDYPDEVESKIKPFLAQQGVNFTNYVQNFKRQEDLIDLLNPEWQGAVPATFIYDTDGAQREFLLGKRTLEEFTPVIEKLRRN